jgi:hypothetical protein
LAWRKSVEELHTCGWRESRHMVFHPPANLLPMDGHLRRRREAKLHAIAAHFQHNERDVLTDDDALSALSAQN